MFNPNANIKKSEFANILYKLMDKSNIPDTKNTFADLDEKSPHYNTFNTLVNAGLVKVDTQNKLNINADITRIDVVRLIAPFVLDAQKDVVIKDIDENSDSYKNVQKLVASGLLTIKKDGNFEPNATINRARTAIIFNTLLNRDVKKELQEIEDKDIKLPIILDVDKSNWAYSNILSAVIEYTVEDKKNIKYDKLKRDNWLVSYNGRLYYAKNGDFVRDEKIGTRQFDKDGVYTTGNVDLDKKMREILLSITNDNMNEEQKLSAIYDYMKNNHKYLKKSHIQIGQRGWTGDRTYEMFTKKKGNWYSFAAGFYYLLKYSGIDATIVQGKAGRRTMQSHSWVEIKLSDGKSYVYDPELEMSYKPAKKPLKFYKFTYKNPPIKYQKYNKQGI